MLFYYVQIKDRRKHHPGVNIREKASIESVNEVGCSSGGGVRGVGWGALRLLAGILGGRTP